MVDQPAVFIGSSAEGEHLAECLQVHLAKVSEPTVWSQGVFGVGGTTIGSLARASQEYDFAVLVLTADDVTESRGARRTVARDNVLFEAGLFIGALGMERTFLMMCRDDSPKLPSDLNGLTVALFNRRDDGNYVAAVAPAALAVKQAMNAAGPKRKLPPAAEPERGVALSVAEERAELEREIDIVARAARAHGWKIKTRSSSAFRVVDPEGQKHSLTIGDPHATRVALRDFALEMNRAGVRVSRAVLPEDAPKAPTVRRRGRRR